MLLPTYLAVRIAENVLSARVNDAWLVAGMREVHSAVPSRAFPTTIDVSTNEAFVWRGGKIVFHDPAYSCAAGPNAKGQVALGGKAGLFVWQDGRLTRCLDKPIAQIAGIADDGSVVATPESSDWKTRIVWPSDRTADGRYRFGPRAPSGGPTTDAPSGIDEYAADGSYLAHHGDNSVSGRHSEDVRTPGGFWHFRPGRDEVYPHGLTRNGYAIASGPDATAVWHNGDLLQQGFSIGASQWPEGVHAVNGAGDAVGRIEGRTMLWSQGIALDLGVATAGPKLDDAIAISDRGDVLARSGPTLYLLRRGG